MRAVAIGWSNYLPRGAEDVAVQPDGGIVVAGEGDCRYSACFALARYRPDGSLDPGFGEGGVVRTAFGLLHASRALDVTLAPGGKIVAAGFVQTGGDANGSTRFAVARYLPDGRLDTSFSRDGRATVDFGYGPDQAYAVATQRKRSRRSPASAVPSAPGARRLRPVP